MIKIVKDEVPNGVIWDLAHKNQYHMDENEWSDKDFNYRLNVCDTIFFAIKNNKVVGHLGIREDKVQSIFVEESHRGEGIALELYFKAFDVYPVLYSDDAREPAGTKLWERLMGMYPNLITYLPRQDQYLYKKND